MSQCTDLQNIAHAGVAPALRAVDCVAGEMTAGAFNRLFGAEGALAPVLTLLLTLYIAFFAFSLLTGRSKLGVSALTPRMLTLGLVLTFATSWAAYSQVVWNLAVLAPDWIAGVLTGMAGDSASRIFADRIDIVFAAIGQAGEAAGQAGGEGNGAAGGGALAGMFQPADIMWLGALILLLGTVGVLLTARIALAVLVALGPIFVVMGMFEGTRGLTAGWLRGVALTALTPLFVVLGGSITLELLVPVLSVLNGGIEGVSGRAAMGVFLIASVHAALMVMVMKVAGTMVAGWQVFGLGASRSKSDDRGSSVAWTPGTPVFGAAGGTGDAGQASSGRRSPVVAPVVTMQDNGGESAGGTVRSSERRTVVTQVTGGGVEPMRTPGGTSRARGIGSRFRAASNDAGRRPKEMGR